MVLDSTPIGGLLPARCSHRLLYRKRGMRARAGEFTSTSRFPGAVLLLLLKLLMRQGGRRAIACSLEDVMVDLCNAALSAEQSATEYSMYRGP